MSLEIIFLLIQNVKIMSWILWVIVVFAGLFLLAALYGLLLATGILSEFFIFVLFCGAGAVLGAVCELPQVGFIIGALIYLIRCFYHIAFPKETTLIEGWDDGSTTKRKLSTAEKGWAGIAMLVLLPIIIGVIALFS